ncbi:MAG: 2-amino-4-hydroxy-6-hydroxymethyldihydropteridine diphosphokinase [Gammaproteobacteria bacterium]|nr:2-amino-4-hydroxy-6-hydroxymethyldihydropteridine diphosphokinase [Gammaproteobacteria bacterium]
MPRVWVSIGSNIDRETNIRGGIAALRELFGELVVSPVYEAEAVGFEGDAFLNLVAGFYSELPPARLHGLMRAIEARFGRERSGEKFSARTLDIDVLTYGDQVTDEGGKQLPRDEILRYAFVLAPLADVAGDEPHPESGRTYAELWQAFEGSRNVRRLDDVEWATA